MSVDTRAGTTKGLAVGGLGLRLRWRTILVVGCAAALLLLAVAAHIGLGSYRIPLGEVFEVLLGGGAESQRGAVLDVRLPRALVGVLVGAALGLAGALFQSISRNPLASPDVLGITWGASVGAVTVIAFAGSYGQLSGFADGVGVPLASLLGGLLAGLALYGLSWRRGIDGYRMVLIGIGIAAVGANLVFWLLTVGDVQVAARAMTWLTGSLAAAGWGDVPAVALAVGVLAPLTLFGARVLGVLRFGEDTARGLGVRVNLSRTVLLLLAVLLAAVATAAAGPIGFVALAAPQIALRLCAVAGPPLGASMVLGATLTVCADLAARTLPGVELPVGVYTAVLGAPYLMFLLIRSRREARV
ncbi:iron complex transport system permease protein [Tamaricihabitans halophyticus]|uniref:Iron complex transport system permease protein n=1 Tax=Tamaricihabitans halophyticus TaxID=1262583 RepID=A0A4R2R3W8_9PSEU|nr:iron chelate uptake ABC transporter family permease subunit [Tamaricihabitans halophyticus]TCP56717.1 iron complex transport system permease protein [Tamaricihabitans halophyticus]